MECHGISGISSLKALTKRESVGLSLFMDLSPMREHVIMRRDACGLSSLKERGTLDVFLS